MSHDRFADGIRAAARVLAANGIDARPYLDRLDDATRAEIGGMLGGRPPGLRTEWRCGCGAWNRAPCRVCGRGPDERYASGAELDALAGKRAPVKRSRRRAR